MTLQHAFPLLLWVCIYFVTLVTATKHSTEHKVRQGPISTTSQPISPGPGPVSLQTSTSTSDSDTETMSPTSTSVLTLSPTSTAPTSSDLPSPETTSYSSAETSSATHEPTSSSSSSPSPSPSATSLDFTVQNLTTCTSALISWNYSGKEAELFLSITNASLTVDSVDVSSRMRARQGPIVVAHQLADTNTSAKSWTWPSVNVTQGWYEIQALALTSPTTHGSSAPFFVSNGTDVTCLTGASSPGTPLSTSSGSHSTQTSSVVGGVVGAIVGVAFVVFAGLYLRSRRRRKLSFFGGVGFRRKKWGSLKSTASSIQPESRGSTSQRSSANYHVHSESMGAILQDIAGGKDSPSITPGGSEEDAAVVGEEKLSPASSTGMSPIGVLNTSFHQDRRASAHSDQPPSAVANEVFRSAAASQRISTQSLSQNLEQQAQRIRNSMETSARRRSGHISLPSLPSPGLSHLPRSPTLNQTQEEYPLSPVTPIPVNRSISTSAVSVTTRRTPRKPVPQYDSSLLREDTKADSVSTIAGGADSLQSHGTGMAAGANGTPLDLVHNASFGDGRPVHYLIPDMPPRQQD